MWESCSSDMISCYVTSATNCLQRGKRERIRQGRDGGGVELKAGKDCQVISLTPRCLSALFISQSKKAFTDSESKHGRLEQVDVHIHLFTQHYVCTGPLLPKKRRMNI